MLANDRALITVRQRRSSSIEILYRAIKLLQSVNIVQIAHRICARRVLTPEASSHHRHHHRIGRNRIVRYGGNQGLRQNKMPPALFNRSGYLIAPDIAERSSR